MIDRERPKVQETRQKVMEIFNKAMERWKGEAQGWVSQVNKASDLVPVALNSLALTKQETKELLDVLAEMAKDGALESLANMVGAGFDIDVEEAASYLAEQWARNYGGVMIKQVTQSTREGVANIIANGMKSGETNETIARTIRESYTLSHERSVLIARTETAYADVAGNVATYTEAGVESKRWVLGSDSCEVCVGNASVGVIPFNDIFPSGDFAPPAHPNCTCDIIPVLE